MGALAKGVADDVGGLVAQHSLEFGADKGVAALRIHNKDEVGEAVNQAAGKLLLLVELLFHGAAFGDVHQGALKADDAAIVVADSGSGVEAMKRLAIFAAQG